MKFYETHYEEYIHSTQIFNLHKNISEKITKFPNNIKSFGNLIVYGPQGSGKYTQVLQMIKKYSSNELKHDKKIICQTEKHQYIYHISDVHYEIDMSLLGCNSKILWHEIFFQIIDIISIKHEKVGIILCKNFHNIHTELLDTFYSYMQHCNNYHSIMKNNEKGGQNEKIISSISSIQIHFILLTEHISFIPNNILNSCTVIRIPKPNLDNYISIVQSSTTNNMTTQERPLIQRISDFRKTEKQKADIKDIIVNINTDGISNIKEINSFSLVTTAQDLPKDIFNIICDNIIHEIIHYNKIVYTEFRDIIYDILIYNLDIAECLWYILLFFIQNKYLSDEDISNILTKIFIFMKYYNNNYRPIYHLESMLYYIILRVHKIQ